MIEEPRRSRGPDAQKHQCVTKTNEENPQGREKSQSAPPRCLPTLSDFNREFPAH